MIGNAAVTVADVGAAQDAQQIQTNFVRVEVLEKILRHLEQGESPAEAAEKGGGEVALPVLAATLVTVVVLFPVTFLYGVSRFLFTALALAVLFSMFSSYVVAMTVVPLLCARFLKAQHPTSDARAARRQSRSPQALFNRGFEHMLGAYDRLLIRALRRPWTILAGTAVLFPKLLGRLEIRCVYMLGIRPVDGKYHRVNLKLIRTPGLPRMQVYFRPGYHAPEPPEDAKATSPRVLRVRTH